VLLLGVNGVGKTTSAAKIASLFSSQGKSAILAACDTFRAAAIDQLKIHGERLGIRVVAHKPGGDAADVFYDALFAAKSAPADGGILVVADTAGRMHTKSALLEELKKIDRVTEKFQGQEGGVRVNTLRYLVLDATTGGNALSQAEVFGGAVPLDGVILTKYDSTAKGGVVFSLASREKLPVAYLCSGEHYPDIAEFDAARFVKEFCNG
jgi:fused signal recognition particle receptor